MTFLVTSIYKSSEEPLSEGATPYYFWIFARKLTVRASETIATKLDIFGGVLVTQAFVVAGDRLS